MRRHITNVFLIILSISLTGCLTDNGGVKKQDVGMVTGGVLGGVLGSTIGGGTGKTAATIGGVLLGAYIGGAIGKSMDDTDKLKMQQSIESNRTGHTSTWTNPDTGNTYSVTPTRTYTRQSGGISQPCREYRTVGYVGGKKEEIHGTACRQSDGSWKAVS